MIESGLSNWALANSAIQAQLGQSSIDVQGKTYSAFFFGFLGKQPPLPCIVLDRIPRGAEAADTLDPRSPAPTKLIGHFQFGCCANDNPVGTGPGKNPLNSSGYLSCAALSRVLREQLLGLDTGTPTGYLLPDGTAVSDLWIVDEFDAHFELGGTGYLYRRVLQVGMLFKETA
jgi:hypothetical protein